MKLSFLFLTIVILLINSCKPAKIEWQKSLGGIGDDGASSVEQTKDGGYIIAGYSRSTEINNSEIKNIGDYCVVKIDSKGILQWKKSFGLSNSEGINSVKQTKDGGYILAGYSGLGHSSFQDYWIIKLDEMGSIKWEKKLGGNFNDNAYDIDETKDGGYIIAGFTHSFNNDGGDVTENHGGDDFWIVKLGSEGKILWEKSFGGKQDDIARSIIKTKDGGYIIAGKTSSKDENVPGNHSQGNYDFWVIRLDFNGILMWQKCFGGMGDDGALSILQNDDGGFVVAGYANSNDIEGDVKGNHGDYDFWIVKLDSIGTLIWSKTLGGENDDRAFSIQQTKDKGYIVAGYTKSIKGDVKGNHGGIDCWIVKLESNGDLKWQKTLGGSKDDGAISIKQTKDGGYILAGFTNSNDFDVTENNGKQDSWIVKLK